ncbi:MAG: hypothetical protein HY320_03260 [Armatimonadetes bacterium]|nr:hypothetical protein [Armatimonadota bacterium]
MLSRAIPQAALHAPVQAHRGRAVGIAGALLFWLAATLASSMPSGLPRPLLEDTQPVTFTDAADRPVTVRLPAHLGAAVYAPHKIGTSLWSPRRRAEIYRDALLDLSLQPDAPRSAAVWDRSLQRLAERAGLPPEGVAFLRRGTGALDDLLNGKALKGRPGVVFTRQMRALLDNTHALPAYPHLQAVLRAVGGLDCLLPVAEPILAAIQLRALATDEAEERLARLRLALHPDDPAADPALWDGYRAAEAEFQRLRDSFWSALVGQLAKGGGGIAWAALREVAGQTLGPLAVLGRPAVDAVAGLFTLDREGQRATLLATLAGQLLALLETETDPVLREMAVYAQMAAYRHAEQSVPPDVLGPLHLRPSLPNWRAHYARRAAEMHAALAAGP